MKLQRFLSTAFLGFLSFLIAYGQQGSTVFGVVCDPSGNSLPRATISLTGQDESGKKFYTTADLDGKFSLKLPQMGNYTVLVSYIGYSTFTKKIVVAKTNLSLGAISLKELAINLDEAKVQGRATRSEQKGDTMQYNAQAFKVIKGSNAEDLIAKMPGVVVLNGSVKAQGEEVKKVLLDGKQFFEGDVTTALRIIPSDIISSVQVFDKKSEQAQFTGFDDGQSTKTINVVTNRKTSNSYFGKMVAGYGSDNRYQFSGSLNLFSGNRRITLLGMSNNINQQNFSQEDIVGIMSGAKGALRGGGGMPPPPGGGITDNLVGQLGGLSKTNALGMNYTDSWGKKIEVTAGYFFNSTDNVAQKSLDRTYFDETNGKRTYSENSIAQTKTYNHRFNMKLDYTIDEKNSISFIPRVSLQKTNYSTSQSASLFDNGVANGATTSSTIGDGDGYNLNGLLLFRHKFEKIGRTFSLGVNAGASNNDKTYLYNSTSSTGSDQTVLKQQVLNNNSNYSWGGNFMYTEPLAKNMQLMTNYSVNYQSSDADKKTYDFDRNLTYSSLNDTLSNVYSSNYVTHRFGSGIRIANKKVNLMAGLNVQLATFDGDQQYPAISTTSKNFLSVLPMAMANITINRYKALRIGLFSMSSAPSVSQLQNVVDNSNTLMLSSGNPNLKEQISNMFHVRYTHSSITGQTFVAMLHVSNKHNYIGDSVYVADQNTTLANGIVLQKGSQMTKPVNLNGYWSASSMFTYGFPVDLLRSNLNLSADLGYSRLPGIYNGVTRVTQNYSIAPSAVLGSNISDKLDFTLNYSANVSVANGKAGDKSNTTYLTQTSGAKLEWIMFAGITLGSQLNWQSYSGLSSNYNQNYFLLNANLGKKILKNQAGEIKIHAYDLLRQNKSVSRNIASNYYEDTTTNVLKPYFMVSFTYDLKKI